jgi:hypothetical protein
MKKKSTITAEELLAELQRDPVWVARQDSKQKKRDQLTQEFASLEQPLLSQLRDAGLDVRSIGNAKYFESQLPLKPKVIQVLLEWLPRAHWRMQEPIARILGLATTPFDGNALCKTFDDTLSKDLDRLPLDEATSLSSLRWAIANTIAEARPLGVTSWVSKKASDSTLGKSREMLLLAAARLMPRAEAVEALKSAFEEFPAISALGLSEIGGDEEKAFLSEKEQEYDGEVRKEIEMAVARLAGKTAAI